VLGPVHHGQQRFRPQAAGAALGIASAVDESGTFQHLQMAGDSGQADLKRLRKLEHGGFAAGQPRDDGPSRRIGQGGKRGIQGNVDDQEYKGFPTIPFFTKASCASLRPPCS
jgi:hypothetical protein